MTSSERPSPEPILKKEASPAVLGGREFWKRSESLKCLELEGLGHPSRTLKGNSRKRSESVSGVFPEFFRKVPAVLGVWPKLCAGAPSSCVRSHLGTPALKTEDFSKKIGRFSKTQKWIY